MGKIDHNRFAPKVPVVINGTQIVPIEVDGQRVVTLAMIDEVHSRTSGTARRNFNTNKARLVEGEDFRVLTQADEIRSLGLKRPQGGIPESVTVMTESGYLMLVKSFNDDLAWTVQKQLVRTYFKAKSSISVARTTPRIDVSRECRLSMAEGRRWAKAMGLIGNQAILAANRLVNGTTGIDPLGLMGITHIDAPQNEALLSPSEIGARIGGVSGQAVNNALCTLGLQLSFRDAKNHKYYEPTQAGVEAGGVMQDANKKHGNGVPIRQLRWTSSIVHVVEAELQREGSE